MKHLVLDFETMSKDENTCAVIDMSFFVFDTDVMTSKSPYNLETIEQIRRLKLNVEKQVTDYEFVVEKDTLKFWQEQEPEVIKLIMPRKTDLTVKEFTESFIDYLSTAGKIDYWWSRSNSYDPRILWRLFKAVNKDTILNQYLPFWKVRDTRTFIDAKLDFPKENSFAPMSDTAKWEKAFKKHNSSWDVLADGLRMQAIFRAELDLDSI